MKLGNITRKILRVISNLHQGAIVRDCRCADAAADKRFERAAHQLELVRAAQDHLAKLQEQALEARAKADHEWRVASNELKSLKAGL